MYISYLLLHYLESYIGTRLFQYGAWKWAIEDKSGQKENQQHCRGWHLDLKNAETQVRFLFLLAALNFFCLKRASPLFALS